MNIEALGNKMPATAQTTIKSEPVKAAAESRDAAAAEVKNALEAGISLTKAENPGETKENGRDQQMSQEQMKQAVDKINKNMNNCEVQFGIHEATNRVTIKIIDKETKEVIKELPPEKTLDMIAKAWELAGILVDEKR